MNNMNPFYQEQIVLRQSKELEAEIYQIRLQNEAMNASSSRSTNEGFGAAQKLILRFIAAVLVACLVMALVSYLA